MVKNQKGQAVIILLLIMVVGLTIGISVVSRSLLNVKMSTQLEESSRAFTAAEAGIEVALEATSGTEFTSTDPNLNYDCQKNIQGAGNSYVFYNVSQDRTVQLYFSDPNNIENQSYAGKKIRVAWGKSMNAPLPAMEVSLLYETKAVDTTEKSYHVAKFTLDPDDARATTQNNFCHPSADPNCATDPSVMQPLLSQFTTDNTDVIDGASFQFGATVDVESFNTGNNFLIFGRFRLLYNGESTSIGIKDLTTPESIFPSQGSVIDCLGSRESGVSRRIKVYENFPAIPELFDYVLFNGSQGSGLGH